MAINLQVYSNAYNTTKTIAIDFVSDIATISDDTSVDDTTRYFFKMTTSAKDTDNLSYTPRIVEDMSDLALNKTKRSTSDDATPYSGINDLVLDYLWDYMQGHSANQFTSGCTYKAPLKTTA